MSGRAASQKSSDLINSTSVYLPKVQKTSVLMVAFSPSVCIYSTPGYDEQKSGGFIINCSNS